MLTLVCSQPAASEEPRVTGKHVCGHFQVQWTHVDGEGRAGGMASGPQKSELPACSSLPPAGQLLGRDRVASASVFRRMAPIWVPVCGAGGCRPCRADAECFPGSTGRGSVQGAAAGAWVCRGLLLGPVRN